MGFPLTWRRWIWGILSSARASVLVNGSPTEEFSCHRGLRQGDPLSPFLFIIAMEALSFIVKKASVLGLFHGIRCTSTGPLLTHFLYADDVVFLGDWSMSNVKNLCRLLRCFYLSSGLRVNLAKSSLFGVGVDSSELDRVAASLHCKAGVFPFNYLGLQVGANMNLVKNWKPVIDTFRSRLSRWKARSLSYGGRLVLLKSVLSSLPTYYFSLYRAPLQVIDQLEQLRRRFFGGGSEDNSKITWVAWDKVLSLKNYGGIGLGSLRDANLAMLAKWWWRFKVDQSGLWRKVIWAIHSSSRAWSFLPNRLSLPGPWNNICKISSAIVSKGVTLSLSIRGVPGNGETIHFWTDLWCGDTTLAERFPLLFNLESKKLSRVADRITGFNQFVFGWKRSPSSQQELMEHNNLLQAICYHSPSLRSDSWIWEIGANKEFSVKSLKQKLQVFSLHQPSFNFFWNSWVPSKVSILAWRAEMDRLPVRQSLWARHVQVQSVQCPICGDYEETAEHLFVSCAFVHTVWHAVTTWCKFAPFFPFGIRDLLDAHNFVQGTAKWKKLMHGIVLTTIWVVWGSRNNLIFAGKMVNCNQIVHEVQALSFLWIKSRGKFFGLDWESWRQFSVSHMF